jgi:predicted nucleic acid-binding protein
VSLFVDTSALYAAMDRDDEFHGRASAHWKECLSGTGVLVTSNYILVETLALVQSRLGMEATRVLASDVVPALEIEWVSADDHRVALEAVLAANRRSLSFVDCASFQVMRRLGLRSAFAFDPQFAEHGFHVTPS